MKTILEENQLTLPLYHGTSSLFLESIVKRGLGGANPIEELRVHELAEEVLALGEEHLGGNEVFEEFVHTFRLMVKQQAGNMNWQHGDTYLSPSRQTALRYACHKRFGSELLSHTFIILDELVRHDVADVRRGLLRRYASANRCFRINPAPILIRADRVPVNALVGEGGDSAAERLTKIERILNDEFLSEDMDTMTQQFNFRLCSEIKADKLQFWLVSTLNEHFGYSDAKLYEIKTDSSD